MAFDTMEITSVLHMTGEEDEAAVRKEIFAAIGDLGEWYPWNRWVIGATYIWGGRTQGGIIIPDQKGGMLHNDQLLGKAFLLVAYGPGAFPDKLLDLYHGEVPKVGSWFWAMAREGREISLKFPGASSNNRREQAGWPCRAFLAEHIMGPIPHPACIV